MQNLPQFIIISKLLILLALKIPNVGSSILSLATILISFKSIKSPAQAIIIPEVGMIV